MRAVLVLLGGPFGFAGGPRDAGFDETSPNPAEVGKSVQVNHEVLSDERSFVVQRNDLALGPSAGGSREIEARAETASARHDPSLVADAIVLLDVADETG